MKSYIIPELNRIAGARSQDAANDKYYRTNFNHAHMIINWNLYTDKFKQNLSNEYTGYSILQVTKR